MTGWSHASADAGAGAFGPSPTRAVYLPPPLGVGDGLADFAGEARMDEEVEDE